jgi:Zn-finger nucleic acid-binding protein
MKCPFDDTSLKSVERNGIEIDWCETCKGVWLERGELDKILDKAASEHAREVDFYRLKPKSNDYDNRRFEKDDDRKPSYPRNDYKKKKKSGFLSEMFEF